jgi:peptidyl-lysine (3S)-dioxygenase / protease
MSSRTQAIKDITDFIACSRVAEAPATISPLEFFRTFVAASRPCVIRGGARRSNDGGMFKHWPACSLWQDDAYLLASLADKTVTVNYTPDGHGDCVREGDKFVKPEERRVPFADVWRQLTARGDSMAGEWEPTCEGVPYCSIQNDCLRQEFQPLMKDIDIGGIALANEALGTTLEAVNIWMGDERSVSSVHKDPFENFYCVVRGSKKFVLLPPTDAPYLGEKQFRQATYHRTGGDDGGFEIRLDDDDGVVPWCTVDPLSPDLEKFPEFAHASPVTVDIEAGDLLYLPALWYHRVSHNHVGPSIAVNYWYEMSFETSAYVAMMLRRELAGMNVNT